MPSANKTPNYNLTQYSNNGSDKISALKDYNEDMSKIDTALNGNANAITNKADASNVYTKKEVDDTVTGINSSISTKANKSTTYTKDDVDSIFSTISSIAIENKEDIDDYSTIINNALSSGKSVVLTNGIYDIKQTIIIPTVDNAPISITGFNGSALRAASPMTDVVKIVNNYGKVNENLTKISGFFIDGSGIADNGIHVTGEVIGYKITDMVIDNCKNSSIYSERPKYHGGSNDAIYDNIYINQSNDGKSVSYPIVSKYGLNIQANDCIISNIHSSMCDIAFALGGYAQISNIHAIAPDVQYANNGNCIAFASANGAMIDNAYIDGYNKAVYQCDENKVQLFNIQNFIINNFYYYQWNNINDTVPGAVIVFNIYIYSRFSVNNLLASIDSSKSAVSKVFIPYIQNVDNCSYMIDPQDENIFIKMNNVTTLGYTYTDAYSIDPMFFVNVVNSTNQQRLLKPYLELDSKSSQELFTIELNNDYRYFSRLVRFDLLSDSDEGIYSSVALKIVGPSSTVRNLSITNYIKTTKVELNYSIVTNTNKIQVKFYLTNISDAMFKTFVRLTEYPGYVMSFTNKNIITTATNLSGHFSLGA